MLPMEYLLSGLALRGENPDDRPFLERLFRLEPSRRAGFCGLAGTDAAYVPGQPVRFTAPSLCQRLCRWRFLYRRIQCMRRWQALPVQDGSRCTGGRCIPDPAELRHRAWLGVAACGAASGRHAGQDRQPQRGDEQPCSAVVPASGLRADRPVRSLLAYDLAAIDMSALTGMSCIAKSNYVGFQSFFYCGLAAVKPAKGYWS